MSNRVTIEQLADWLRDKDDIVVLGHVNPDGDAAGSCLAVGMALRAMGKRCVVALPGGMPKLYSMLPGAEVVLDTARPLPFAPMTALSVDVSDLGRFGEAGQRLFEGCGHRAALDHHVTNPGLGEVYALDGDAAAVGEMAVGLIDALGVPLTEDMANCLYVAILTDCGQFGFSNTRPQTYLAAARCAEAGAKVSELSEALYRTRTRARTKLTGLVLAGLETSADGKLAWARLTEDMLKEADATREDNEGIVNYLVEIDGAVLGMLAEQRGESTKLSLRSKAPLDVARDVAAPLGGGGHSRAAGVTLDMPMDEAVERALALARRALDEAR